MLEGSIILDETPQAERIFALFSDRPLSWDEVQAAARRAWQEAIREARGVDPIDRLPLDWPQVTILLPKGPTGPVP